MKDILNEILESKKKEVAERKELIPVKLLEKSIFYETQPVSLKRYILREDKSGVIAEIKKKSPSLGHINPHVSVERTSIGYMQGGASALSILTDKSYFGGSNDDLTLARKYNFCPILRKDFILDAYQVVESKSIGADAILLIAAALKPDQQRDLARLAHDLGMEVLLEVHNKEELERSNLEHVDLVGVNNRNLEDFSVDINTSMELGAMIPEDKVKVAESGIREVSQAVALYKAGYRGFLIGGHFMKESRPEWACEKFIDELMKSLPVQQNA